MSFFPGWGSVDSTAAIAHNLHITAVVVLGLLFIAEGMALIYDSRNHRLVTTAEQQRSDNQKLADNAAAARVSELHDQLSDATKKAEEERIAREPLSLTPVQQASLTEACRPLAGKRVAVSSYGDDPTTGVLAHQITAALKDAGVDSFRHSASNIRKEDALAEGVVIIGNDKDLVRDLSAAIAAAMPDMPISNDVHSSALEAAGGGPATIFIGLKAKKTAK